jgi:FKBP-type peptidyl-prolyl cis-trans isomerase FkpA
MKYFLALISILVIYSCKTDTVFEGFNYDKGGVYFQLHTLGEDSLTIEPGDYVTCDLVYSTQADSQFFKARRKFQLATSFDKGEFDYCVTLLNVGDSASFMIPAKLFFEKTLQSNLPDLFKLDDYLKVSVKALNVQSQDDFLNEKEAFLSWIQDFGQYEQVIMEQFLDAQKIESKPTASGMYYIPLKQGKGEKVKKGDTLVIHYEGKFLNGKFFDSTLKRKEAFSFVYGTEWQVIEGLEEALGYMSEGEKALFIMPSELAWGKSGSSTGIIPPYTSLIFEVELLEVN